MSGLRVSHHPIWFFVAATVAICIGGCAAGPTEPIEPSAGASADASADAIIKEQSGRIPEEALNTAFDYLHSHAADVKNRDYVTIIDFDQPSTAKRMHVIDVRTGQVEDFLVAHAKKSGEDMAVRFSNMPGSNMSSLGLYLTGEQIVSPKHGTAMLLHGMQETNSNAERREIIFHGAEYVSEKFIEANGRLGRSLGCPAVEDAVVERLVKQLKGGSVMLIYKSGEAPAATTQKTAG
jgi:hypothetical protein